MSPERKMPRSRSMARGDTLHRTLRVIRLLELNPRGLSVKQIEDRLKADEHIEVHAKTIRRDIDVVEASGFPIEKLEGGVYRLAPIAKITKSITFSYEELLALYLARETFETQRGSPLYNHLRTFFGRLEDILGPRAHEGLRDLKSHVGIKPEPSWSSGVPSEVLETVHQACAEGQMLRIEYRAKPGLSEPSEVDQIQRMTSVRDVGPEAIYFADAGAYLVARDRDGQFKLFALGRVRSAVMLDEAYVSSGFSMSEFLRDGIGVLRLGEVDDVVIHIREPMASYVSERRWHESQSVTRTQNGIEVRLRVRVNDELARWVLGLGPDAEVVSPKTLRARVSELADLIANRTRKAAG